MVELIPSRATGPEQVNRRAQPCLPRLASLRPDERKAPGFQAASFTYAEIAERRGWTYTKTHRSIGQGRASLRELAAAR